MSKDESPIYMFDPDEPESTDARGLIKLIIKISGGTLSPERANIVLLIVSLVLFIGAAWYAWSVTQQQTPELIAPAGNVIVDTPNEPPHLLEPVY